MTSPSVEVQVGSDVRNRKPDVDDRLKSSMVTEGEDETSSVCPEVRQKTCLVQVRVESLNRDIEKTGLVERRSRRELT